jgi:hypothetical protein
MPSLAAIDTKAHTYEIRRIINGKQKLKVQNEACGHG